MKLYNYCRSSASYRVRLALDVKGLKYEYVPVHLLNNGGEQNQSAYAKMSPLKQVPTLVDNGFVLSQSLPIIEYLEEAYPEVRLFPHSLKDRSKVREFCEIINSGIQPLHNLKPLNTLSTMFGATTDAKKKWTYVWLESGFSAIENFMQEHSRSYTYGNTVTAADCFLLPQIFSAQRQDFDITKFPNVQRVYQLLSTHPLMQKSHPSQQPDFND